MRIRLHLNWFQIVVLSLLLINMAVIFINSAMPVAKSARFSGSVAESVTSEYKEFTQKDTASTFIEAFTKHIRLYAHGIEFFPLGGLSLLTAFAFRKCFRRTWLCVVSAPLFCVLYALLDETHQLFVAGRTFELVDLKLDCLGSLMGLLLTGVVLLLCKWVKHIKAQNKMSRCN